MAKAKLDYYNVMFSVYNNDVEGEFMITVKAEDRDSAFELASEIFNETKWEVSVNKSKKKVKD